MRCAAIALSAAMIFSMIGVQDNFPVKAAGETEELDGWALADTGSDPDDTLECVWDSEEHGLVLKKTEHFTSSTTGPNASAIDKTFSNGIEGNTKYKVSFDIKGEGSDPHYLVHVFFWNAEGTTLLNQQYSIVGDTAISPSEGWKNVGFDVTSPENAGMMTIRVQSYGAADGDAVCLDNAKVQKYVEQQVEEEPTYELLPITNGYSSDRTWYGYNGSTGANLGDGVVSIVEEGADDKGALKINHTYGCGYDIYVKVILPDILPVGEYTISANTKGNSNGQEFYVACKSGTTNDCVYFEETKECNTSEWKSFSKTITIPEGYKEIFVGVSQYQETADLYIDNIKLVNNSDGKDYFADYGNFCKKVTTGTTVEVLDETDLLAGSGAFESIYDVFTTGTSGNINQDEATDVKDLVHMKRYLAKNIDKAAMADDSDLTGDRLVKQDDATKLRQILVASPQYKLVTLCEGYTGGEWYQTFTNTTADDQLAEIVQEGNLDAGALHYVRQDKFTSETHAIMYEASEAQTGTYKLTMYLKGSINIGNEFKILQSGYDSQVYQPLSEGAAYNLAEWTKYETTMTITRGEDAPLIMILFGGYTWKTDLYIDNISLVNEETGEDILQGKGNFCELVTTP